MDFSHSPRSQDFLKRVRTFIEERVLPFEERRFRELASEPKSGDWKSWTLAPEIDAMKAEAKAQGLWNLFLPDPKHGAALSSVEYAPLAEQMGRSAIAPEVFNCNAPDTGNMEVLWKYGTPEQKDQWLTPLLEGRIRSVFCITEPDVASSDATNMQATCTVDGDEIVLNGKKWWTTGLGHPNAKVAIFMGVTDPSADRHHQHSMVLVPLDSKGITIKRMLSVFGDYDAPYGHGEVWFENVRVPKTSFIGGPGKGFEIAQGRLGPGRIHHCMRCIGASELALELLIKRGVSRVAFGKPIVNLGGNREKIADFRVAIDQARLLTLHAAWKLDELGPLGALVDISAIKVVAPSVLQAISDEAIQMHGGAGVSSDFPLTALYAMSRILRIVDGPDAVHRGVIARLELAKYKHLMVDPKAPARS